MRCTLFSREMEVSSATTSPEVAAGALQPQSPSEKGISPESAMFGVDDEFMNMCPRPFEAHNIKAWKSP